MIASRITAAVTPAAKVAGRVLVRSALAYGGLWLALAAFRAYKKNALRRLLKDVVPALEKAGAGTYWVDFGSLRSLASTGDVFVHDNDADLVILEPDFEKLKDSLACALPKGYVVEWVGKERPLGDGLKQRWLRVYLPSKVGGAAEGLRMISKGIQLMWADLYGGWRMGDTIRINKNANCDLPAKLVLPLSKVPLFDAGEAPAPADTQAVMEHRYGPEWHVAQYAVKGRDKTENDKTYLKVLRALGRIGLKI